jgi:hypothetical protein
MADRVIIAYGESGSGKSAGAVELFKAMRRNWASQGLNYIARAYVADGSKATYLDSGLVEAGLIELIDYGSYPWPLDVLNQIAVGWVPEGMVEGAPLVPPYVIGTKPGQPKKLSPGQENFERVRFWIYEGLAVMGNYLMGGHVLGGLAEQAARGVKLGPEAATRVQSIEYEWDDALGAVDTSRPIANSGSGKVYGTNGTAHYMLGQTHMGGFIERAKSNKGWVYMTTHERTAQDKTGLRKEGPLGKDQQTIGAGETVVGPEIIGGALTPVISKAVNETFHFVRATKKTQGAAVDAAVGKRVDEVVTSYRVYTGDHHDPDGNTPLRFKAVTRSPIPEKIKLFYTTEDYIAKHPKAKPAPGLAVVAFYEDLAEAQKQKTAELQAELAAEAAATEAKK